MAVFTFDLPQKAKLLWRTSPTVTAGDRHRDGTRREHFPAGSLGRRWVIGLRIEAILRIFDQTAANFT
jgi:hypothetical protein